MNKQILELIALGNDCARLISQFNGEEERYIKYLRMFRDDDSYEKLKKAIAKKQFEEAFPYAHTLKGIAGNVALTSVFTPASALTEKLRAKEYVGVENDFKKVKAAYTKVYGIIKKL